MVILVLGIACVCVYVCVCVRVCPWCRKYRCASHMQVKILMDEFKNATSSPTGDFVLLLLKKKKINV